MRKWLQHKQPAPHPGRSWREDELWVVDLETTGLNLRRDNIISYGAIPIRRGRIRIAESVYGLVGSTERVPSESACIHHIRTQDLASASPLKMAVAQLDSMISDSPIVAHCAVIEQVLLRRAYHSCGMQLHNQFIDTAVLATMALDETVEGGYLSLEYTAHALGVPVHSPHHALGDAVTTANAFLAIASRLERRQVPQQLTTATLVDLSTT